MPPRAAMSFSSESTSYIITLSVNASGSSQWSFSARSSSSRAAFSTSVRVPGIAAQLPGLGAGQAHAPALQKGLVTHLRLVGLPAKAAGYPQAKPHSVGLRPQLGFFAVTFNAHGGGAEGKACALGQHDFFTVGAQVSKAAHIFHGKVPLSVYIQLIIPAFRAKCHPPPQVFPAPFLTCFFQSVMMKKNQ